MVLGFPAVEALGERLGAAVPVAGFLIPSLFAGLVGLVAGAVLLAIVTLVQRVFRRKP